MSLLKSQMAFGRMLLSAVLLFVVGQGVLATLVLPLAFAYTVVTGTLFTENILSSLITIVGSVYLWSLGTALPLAGGSLIGGLFAIPQPLHRVVYAALCTLPGAMIFGLLLDVELHDVLRLDVSTADVRGFSRFAFSLFGALLFAPASLGVWSVLRTLREAPAADPY